MTKYLWLCHSGGGNLPPSLGVARELRDRGHEVAFLLKPESVGRVEAEGLRAIPLEDAYTRLDAYPPMGPITPTACMLTSPDVTAEIERVVAAEVPDALMIDAMFPAALSVSAGFGLPTTVFCHTFLWHQIDAWQGIFDKLSAMRAKAGFEPLPDMRTLWMAQDRMIVTSVAALDDAPLPGWDHVRHVGPVLDNEARATDAELPWPEDDQTPIVLLSFTTTELAGADKFQTALDALADLPVHVMATTGGAFELNEITAPANAHVVSYADHEPVLKRAALTVTHGGHGTMMRALKHGVPMVVIPGFPHDQVPNAAAIRKWGAGIALPGDADAAAIRAAAQEILADPAYRAEARAGAETVAALDGARAAADEIEAVAITHAPAA